MSFDNLEEFHSSVGVRPILIDKHLGIVQDLLENSSYEFTQRSVAVNDQYIDADRFVLRLATADDALERSGINITYYDSQLEIKSLEMIADIYVYDLYGRQIYSSQKVGLSYYSKFLSLNQGVFIVKVITEKGKHKTEKIVAL